MITRRKAALLQALPQSGTSLVTATPVKTKEEKSEGGETPGGQELVSKMQVVCLDSDSEKDDDDDLEEDSESDYSDEMHASAMSQCSDMSAMDQSSDDESSKKVDGSEIGQSGGAIKVSSPVSIDNLIAEKVLQIITEGGDLKKLTLDYCRSYLRHHGLRVSGNKPVLIDRIKQHIELKQGVPEKYRVATFTINCTGDVCKGDVIKFKQKVYKLSAAKRVGVAVGERIVVGRVVKESYGEKKQQHTFTVEVLWSTGYRPLPPMRQLLVKGRNLYRLRTYRQKWEDEKLRKISLDEKHERGAAARSKRRETLRASGPRKITVGGRKQLPNPYVAMGPSVNFPPDLTGGRGSRGLGAPLHRSWFPAYPSAHGRPFVLPQRPVVPQHYGFNRLRQEASLHNIPPAGVVHHTRVQQSRPGTHDADLAPDRTQNENKQSFDLLKPSSESHSHSCFPFASNASKEGVNFHNISTAVVPTDTRSEAPRLESKIVTGAVPDSERRRIKSPYRPNSVTRREDASFTNNSYAGVAKSTHVQPPREESRTSGAETARSSREIENKSTCRSDINNWRVDTNNRNVPLPAGVSHDSRAPPFRFQSRVVSEADPCIYGRQMGNRSPQSSNMQRWRDDCNNGNTPAIGVPQDTRASPLRPPGTDPFLDRRQYENMSPWRMDQDSWRRDAAGFCKDPFAGGLYGVPVSTRIESRNFQREDRPPSVIRRDENWSPWRYGSNGPIRDGYHHINHRPPVPDHHQAQLGRTQHNVSAYHSPDRRQVANRSPGHYSSTTSMGDVGQPNHLASGRQHTHMPSGALQNHVVSGGQVPALGQPPSGALQNHVVNGGQVPALGQPPSGALQNHVVSGGQVPALGQPPSGALQKHVVSGGQVPALGQPPSGALQNHVVSGGQVPALAQPPSGALQNHVVTGGQVPALAQLPSGALQNHVRSGGQVPALGQPPSGTLQNHVVSGGQVPALAQSPSGALQNHVVSGGQVPALAQSPSVALQNHVRSGGQVPALGQPSTSENFKCPSAGCLNLGSKLCSYRICVKCCKQQGRMCANPKHRRATFT